jgi:hypothetical protein
LSSGEKRNLASYKVRWWVCAISTDVEGSRNFLG